VRERKVGKFGWQVTPGVRFAGSENHSTVCERWFSRAAAGRRRRF
jgi:hypothetical protein